MLLAANFLVRLGAIAMIAVSILLIGLILLQKNRGSGLSGAFGGVGGHSAFGTKTGDFLTWVTVGLVSVFLLLAIFLNFGFTPTKTAVAAPVPGSQTPVAGQPLTVPTNTPVTPMPGAPVGVPIGATTPKPLPMTPVPAPAQSAPPPAPVNVPPPPPPPPAGPPTGPTGG